MPDGSDDEVASLALDAPGGGPGGGPACPFEPWPEALLNWARMLISAGERPTAFEASIANDELLADEDDVALVVDELDALFCWFAARSNCTSRLCWLSPDTERLTYRLAAEETT